MDKYTSADKIFTDNPMLDELVHNLKLILQGIILKDQQEAEDNETFESISNADLYMAITENKVLFSEFVYDGAIMREMNQYIIDNDIALDPFTDEQIAEYVADNSLIPAAYRPILLTIASDEFMDSYVELNNYYRKLNGQKDIGDADFYVDIGFIPSNYYQQFTFPEDLAAYNSDGKSQAQIKNDMRDMCEYYLSNTPITDFSTYQISLLDTLGITDKIVAAFPHVGYLRHLGSRKISIYKARKAERFQILYIPECEYQICARFQDIFDTVRIMYLKRYYSAAYKFENKYYDKFFMLMLIVQVANDIMVEMPEYFISRTVFDERTVQLILEANGVKYFPEIPLKYQVSMVRGLTTLIRYKSTTKNLYDIAKCFFMKDITVYKYYLMKQRNISGDEIIPDDLNGGDPDTLTQYDLDWDNPYYKKYYDICDGGIPSTGQPDSDPDNQFDPINPMRDGGTPLKNVNFVTGKDLDRMYSLFFVKVPVKESLDNYLRDTIYHTPYDVITLNDPYWDGPNDHTYVKYEILKKNFTTQATKYLSLGTEYSMKEYMFEVTYFLNLLLNQKVNADLLNLNVPIISTIAEFNIRDLIILLYCFTFKYFVPQTDDIIDLKNRDPRTNPEVDPAVIVGDYDPDVLWDWDMNGGGPTTRKEYYMADGGRVIQNGTKPINLTGGWPIIDKEPIDWPETMCLPHDASDDTNFDGFGPMEYLEFEMMDGGDPFAVVYDRLIDVYDGGYVVNSYMYTGNEDQPAEDPCWKWHEWCDGFRYPVIDTSTRINGFNMSANLAELQTIIGEINHPKFQWYRGYDLREIIPSYTQTIYEYANVSSFPSVGVVGVLYEDLSTGKYYFWNTTGYTVYDTIYSKGIADFKVPTTDDLQYQSVEELIDIYETDREIYENLVVRMRDCDDQDELFILQFVYDYLFTTEFDLSYYTLPSTGKVATRYTEFLKEKDGIIYAFYESIMSETNVETRQYNMASYIDQVIESIKSYLSTDLLDYVFNFVPTTSWGIVLKYLSLIINFFKSYKTQIIDVGSTLVFDNEEENAMVQKDHLMYKMLYLNKGDWSGIYDIAEFDMSLVKEDDDMSPMERFEDRVFIRETYGKDWVDLNGGPYDVEYSSFDIDATDGTVYPGYLYPTTQYYVLEGGTARDITLDPEPDPMEGDGIDYRPPIWHMYYEDWDCNGDYPFVHLAYYNANGGPIVRQPEDEIIDVDGGWLLGSYAPIDSPHFVGIPTTPDPEEGHPDNQIANTHYVDELMSHISDNLEPKGSADRAYMNAVEYFNRKVDWIKIID